MDVFGQPLFCQPWCAITLIKKKKKDLKSKTQVSMLPLTITSYVALRSLFNLMSPGFLIQEYYNIEPKLLLCKLFMSNT